MGKGIKIFEPRESSDDENSYFIHCFNRFFDGFAVLYFRKWINRNPSWQKNNIRISHILDFQIGHSVFWLFIKIMERKIFRNRCTHHFFIVLGVYKCDILDDLFKTILKWKICSNEFRRTIMSLLSLIYFLSSTY